MLHSGTKTVTTAGTRVALAATRTPAAWVMVQALATNTDAIYVGDKTVSTTIGHELPSSTDSVMFPFSGAPGFYDLAQIYIDAAVSLEGVKFSYGS